MKEDAREVVAGLVDLVEAWMKGPLFKHITFVELPHALIAGKEFLEGETDDQANDS